MVGDAGVASRWKEVGQHSAAVSPSPHSLEVIKFHSNLFPECLTSPALSPSRPLRHHLLPSPIAGYRHTHTQPPRRPKNVVFSPVAPRRVRPQLCQLQKVGLLSYHTPHAYSQLIHYSHQPRILPSLRIHTNPLQIRPLTLR